MKPFGKISANNIQFKFLTVNWKIRRENSKDLYSQ